MWVVRWIGDSGKISYVNICRKLKLSRDKLPWAKEQSFPMIGWREMRGVSWLNILERMHTTFTKESFSPTQSNISEINATATPANYASWTLYSPNLIWIANTQRPMGIGWIHPFPLRRAWILVIQTHIYWISSPLEEGHTKLKSLAQQIESNRSLSFLGVFAFK